MAIHILLRLLDVNYLSAPFALSITAGCGLAVSLFLYLAFLPPAAYLRWIERGAPAPDQGSSPRR